MQLRRIFANAFARRLAYVVVALLLAALGFDSAHAQNTNSANQGQAYTKCLAAHSNAWTAPNSQYDHQAGAGCVEQTVQKYYVCSYQRRAKTCPTCAWSNTGCGNHYWTTNCAALAPLASGWFQVGSGPVCKDGCAYGGSSGGQFTEYNINPGTPAAMAFRNEVGGQLPTGQVCGADQNSTTPLTQEQCSQVGTLTQCVMPNGKHCAQTSGGKKFCWNPTEAGTKYDGNDAATKAPQGIPSNPPPTPPSNNGNWQQTGTGTTVVNNNGNTTTYNNQTYQSDYGSSGSNSGSTNPDGSETGGGDDGEGEGEDHGTVSGGGNCSSPPTFSGGDPVQNYASGLVWQVQCSGQADAAAAGEVAGILDGLNDCVHNLDCGDVGDDGLPLDDADPSNLSDNPLADFQEEITEDDLELSEAGFLGGGSCPQGLSVPVGNTSVSLTFGPLCEVLLNIGGLIMAIAYFVAFRIIAGGL